MIAIDTTTSKDWVSSGLTHTWSHTCTGTNLVLIVCGFGASGRTVTAATYNGIDMNSMTKTNILGYGGHYASMVALLSPSTGANNIVITFNSSGNGSFVAGSYTGARQSSFPDCALATNAGHAINSTTITNTITTATANCWSIANICEYEAPSTTVTNVTKRDDASYGANLFDTNGVIASPGAFSVVLSGASFRVGAQILMAFAPAESPAPSGPSRASIINKFRRHR